MSFAWSWSTNSSELLGKVPLDSGPANNPSTATRVVRFSIENDHGQGVADDSRNGPGVQQAWYSTSLCRTDEVRLVEPPGASVQVKMLVRVSNAALARQDQGRVVDDRIGQLKGDAYYRGRVLPFAFGLLLVSGLFMAMMVFVSFGENIACGQLGMRLQAAADARDGGSLSSGEGNTQMSFLEEHAFAKEDDAGHFSAMCPPAWLIVTSALLLFITIGALVSNLKMGGTSGLLSGCFSQPSDHYADAFRRIVTELGVTLRLKVHVCAPSLNLIALIAASEVSTTRIQIRVNVPRSDLFICADHLVSMLPIFHPPTQANQSPTIDAVCVRCIKSASITHVFTRDREDGSTTEKLETLSIHWLECLPLGEMPDDVVTAVGDLARALNPSNSGLVSIKDCLPTQFLGAQLVDALHEELLLATPSVPDDFYPCAMSPCLRASGFGAAAGLGFALLCTIVSTAPWWSWVLAVIVVTCATCIYFTGRIGNFDASDLDHGDASSSVTALA